MGWVGGGWMNTQDRELVTDVDFPRPAPQSPDEGEPRSREEETFCPWRPWWGPGPCPLSSGCFLMGDSWRPLELEPGWLEPSSAVIRPWHLLVDPTLRLFPAAPQGFKSKASSQGLWPSHSLPTALGVVGLFTWVRCFDDL